MGVLSLFLLLFIAVITATGQMSTGESAKPFVGKAPAADFIANKLPSESTIEDEEIKDIQTEWRKDGTVQLNFTSHGRRHHLELTESKMNLSKVDIRLLGCSTDTEVTVKKQFKKLKLMRDRHQRAMMAFKVEEGKLNLLPEGGVFQQGKHDFRVQKTAGGVKAVKIPTDDHINKTLSDFHAKETRRRKRSSSLPYSLSSVYGNVELVWIIDYSVVRSFNQLVASDISHSLQDSDHIVNILAYYAHLTSMMDDFFGTMNNDYVRVYVDLAGMVVLDDYWELSDLVEDHATGGWVDGREVLDRLSTWLSSSSSDGVLPPYDHVMLSTAYNMDSAAYSYRGKICDSSKSASAVKSFRPLTDNALVATQALALSLGADNDGDGTSSGCSSYDGYIMGSSMSSLEYRFLFSCCSQRSIYSALHRNGDCLIWVHEDPNYHSSFDENVVNYWPGEIFNADDQCYIAYGTQECDNWVYTQTGTNVCTNLYCVSPDDASVCTTYNTPAADGTYCAILSWCMQGACLYGYPQSRSSISDSCFVTSCYGDDERSCTNGVNQYEPERYRCYDDSYRCDAVEDCSDGSDEDWCSYTPTRYCPYGYHTCTTGINAQGKPYFANRYCVSSSLVCDGTDHCTDGSDEESCPVSCSSGYFSCASGTSCVDSGLECDGNNDCTDGSVEASCPVSCGYGYFQCTSGTKCVDDDLVCDGSNDCTDGSDELDCRCPAGYFKCVNGTSCVDSAFECDGNNDCTDGSDEASCPVSCGYGYFQCTSGTNCVDDDLVCDGSNDCTDGSDELDCRCPAGYFKCVNGLSAIGALYGDNSGCIPFDGVCDGMFDHCSDGSDELDCDKRADCYLCSNNACVISAFECDLYCPDDIFCESHFDRSSASDICISYLAICVGFLFSWGYWIV